MEGKRPRPQLSLPQLSLLNEDGQEQEIFEDEDFLGRSPPVCRSGFWDLFCSVVCFTYSQELIADLGATQQDTKKLSLLCDNMMFIISRFLSYTGIYAIFKHLFIVKNFFFALGVGFQSWKMIFYSSISANHFDCWEGLTVFCFISNYVGVRPYEQSLARMAGTPSSPPSPRSWPPPSGPRTCPPSGSPAPPTPSPSPRSRQTYIVNEKSVNVLKTL